MFAAYWAQSAVGSSIVGGVHRYEVGNISRWYKACQSLMALQVWVFPNTSGLFMVPLFLLLAVLLHLP